MMPWLHIPVGFPESLLLHLWMPLPPNERANLAEPLETDLLQFKRHRQQSASEDVKELSLNLNPKTNRNLIFEAQAIHTNG